MKKFNIFLNNIADQYDNIILAGDFNLPQIFWEQTVQASGTNDRRFIEAHMWK